MELNTNPIFVFLSLDKSPLFKLKTFSPSIINDELEFSSGLSSVLSIFNKVVLPAPEVPDIAMISDFFISI